ncbi:MAG: NUDIX domain-containing protein [Pseudomonadota bacterium]
MRERPSARLLVLNAEDRVLLFQFAFHDGALAGKSFWATPGGALDPRESYSDAARRELLEETGISAPVGDQVHQRMTTFSTPSGECVEADERYFVVRVDDEAVDTSGQNYLETIHMKRHRWWSIDDLKATSDAVFPEELVDLMKQIILRNT